MLVKAQNTLLWKQFCYFQLVRNLKAIFLWAFIWHASLGICFLYFTAESDFSKSLNTRVSNSCFFLGGGRKTQISKNAPPPKKLRNRGNYSKNVRTITMSTKNFNFRFFLQKINRLTPLRLSLRVISGIKVFTCTH